MDLVHGAKQVIIIMEHTAKDGNAKIKKACSLPLTGKQVADTIITERGLFHVTQHGLILKEVFSGFTVTDVISTIEAPVHIDLTC
ncbi:MAG: CoA-transferase [Solibacillus sp.]